jgi:signal transduction histidine kinase
MAYRGPDGRVRVAVLDECGGIAEADLPRLFEVGWRGSPDRTPDSGGAGLGLAIARGVVEAHDGTIGVENVDGGCRFELSLPAGTA